MTRLVSAIAFASVLLCAGAALVPEVSVQKVRAQEVSTSPSQASGSPSQASDSYINSPSIGSPSIGSMAETASKQAAPDAAISGNIDTIPAKKLFSRFKGPTHGPARAIGFYSKGCMSGAVALPLTDPETPRAWQVMRPSRNRNWGNPETIAFIEKLARDAKKHDGWNGLLVGDISQPRGGPMSSGHASHQIGMDVDIWLTPMPNRVLTTAERENISAKLMVIDRKRIDPKAWTVSRARLIRRAATNPEVERIFVHPPIKAALCQWATGDRSWLAKVRPYYGHNYHFHVRLACPKNSPNCKPQFAPAPKDGTGCGEELAYWMGDKPWVKAKPKPGTKPPKPAPPLTLRGLPAECRAVVLGH